MHRFALTLLTFSLLTLLSCGEPAPTPESLQLDVDAFLGGYTAKFVALAYAADQADWDANTHIVEGDTSNRDRVNETAQLFAGYTGSTAVIEKTREFLAHRDKLSDLQIRQLESVLYRAAQNPQTVPEVVTRRIAAEAKQNEDLFGFDVKLDGNSLSANEIDQILKESTDLTERRNVWQASKEVGKVLKDGLVELVALRNETAQALGYPSYFAYQVSEYGMTVDEMMELNRGFVQDLWPLYRELHTWTRHALSERYGQDETPELIPAHWIANRWGQDWAELVTVEGIDLNSVLEDQTAEWVVQQAEAFYVSLGLAPLPQVFWDKSSLYPAPPDAAYKKNSHASAWHLNYGDDVRSLMSVEPNQRWWSTTHHELGHIYYYMSYSRPEVPVLLRRGANRGFHEAIGSLLGKASTQKAFLVAKGLIPEDVEIDETKLLLKEALDEVILLPWASGVMSHFEHDLYEEELPADQYNARWWHYKQAFQGIAPPEPRGEEFCDASSKTHINNDPAQYYDYAISQVILHQIHAHIATQILNQDVHDTNYFGRQDVGDFLRGILELGSTRDWREVMREKLGEEISAAPMLAYYEPLMDFLKQQNQGREHTLPESPAI